MDRSKKMTICLAASAGGHLSQLLNVKDGWDGHYTFCVTTSDAVRERLQKHGKVYIVRECNREHPVQFILTLVQCVNVILHERPDAVISTGAAPGCLACFIGKLLGAKVLWVDSITNVERLSLSGRMVRYIADLFLVQWPELAARYRNVQYVGPVI